MCNTCGKRKPISAGSIGGKSYNAYEKQSPIISRVLAIWKRIMNNETAARVEFVNLYLGRYPNNIKITQNLTRENLLTMYVQLTQSKQEF